jgi:predicted restriction endonuclease
MAKKQPNPLQKMVRGFVRDLINQTNDQKPDKSSKPKRKKLVVKNLELDPKPKQNKRSRYIPASIRVSVLTRDNYKCRFCGRSSTQIQLEVDHIKPFSQGGSHEINNLQTLCIDCNRGKGARHLD